MTKINWKLIIYSLLLVVFSSCSKNDLDSYKVIDAVNSESLTDNSKISASSQTVSGFDAGKVAAMYLNTSVATKSNIRSIKEIVQIPDSTGKVLLYAVNFDDGYILVSADKRCPPILGEVEKGTFTDDNEEGALSIVMHDIMDGLSNCIKRTSTPSKNLLWSQFEKKERPEVSLKTKADSDFYQFQNDWIMANEEDFRTIHTLRNKPENMPQDVYDAFCSYAQEMEIDGYDYKDCSLVFEDEHSSITSKGPFIQAHWDQGSPYNNNSTLALGCTTIAAGQIMYYHRYPSSFQWSQMPLTTANNALSSFLLQLKSKIGVDNAGGAYIGDVKKALNYYGYKCDIKSHDASNVVTELGNNRPVYERGEDGNLNEGHAWVCDGYRTTHSDIEYSLYLSAPTHNPENPYIYGLYCSETVYGPSVTVFHMNWGQEGQYDGYFVDWNIQFNYYGDVLNFSSNRKDMFISK